MYGALFRFLPGPVWLRILIFVVLAVAILTACVMWIFPFVNELFVPPEATVGQ